MTFHVSAHKEGGGGASMSIVALPPKRQIGHLKPIVIKVYKSGTPENLWPHPITHRHPVSRMRIMLAGIFFQLSVLIKFVPTANTSLVSSNILLRINSRSSCSQQLARVSAQSSSSLCAALCKRPGQGSTRSCVLTDASVHGKRKVMLLNGCHWCYVLLYIVILRHLFIVHKDLQIHYQCTYFGSAHAPQLGKKSFYSKMRAYPWQKPSNNAYTPETYKCRWSTSGGAIEKAYQLRE